MYVDKKEIKADLNKLFFFYLHLRKNGKTNLKNLRPHSQNSFVSILLCFQCKSPVETKKMLLKTEQQCTLSTS